MTAGDVRTRMSNSSDRERTGTRSDTDPEWHTPPAVAPHLETIPDRGSDTVTFVPLDGEYLDVTTAWITADEDLVVDVAEMH